MFVRAVLGWHYQRAMRDGVAHARSGAIVFAQRFGGTLNLNRCFRALMLDGVCACASTFERPVFHAALALGLLTRSRTRCAAIAVAATGTIRCATASGSPHNQRWCASHGKINGIWS